jgi:hypothetical protein
MDKVAASFQFQSSVSHIAWQLMPRDVLNNESLSGLQVLSVDCLYREAIEISCERGWADLIPLLHRETMFIIDYD